MSKFERYLISLENNEQNIFLPVLEVQKKKIDHQKISGDEGAQKILNKN